MYISRVEIDVQNRKKMRDLTHLGAFHNWVERLFTNEFEDGIRTRKLWRIDELNGKQYLMVVSEKVPNKESFTMYGVEGTAQVRLYDTFLDKLQKGQRMRFRATLNPVISLSSGKSSGERGKVVPCLSKEEKMKYLLDKSERNGFSLSEDEFCISGMQTKKLYKRDGNDATVSTVTYDGNLTITDPSLFRKVLETGLGKKKAYGCGLLTVIPIQNE